MRNLAGVGLIAVCLALAGCSSSGKKSAGANAQAGVPPTPPAERTPLVGTAAAQNSSPPARVNGVIAGQVVDAYNRPRPNTYILVVKAEDAVRQTKDPRGAPIQPDVEANEQGFFFIPDLDPGKQYQLIARAPEGDHLLAGTYVATPPNTRILIRISEDFTTPAIPPIPPRPTWPAPGPGNEYPRAAPRTPNNTLPRPQEPTAPPNTASGSSLPQNIVRGNEGRDWPPRANIPGGASPRLEGPTPSATDLPAVSSNEPRVPYSRVVGRRVEDLALKDIDGKVWQYRKDRTGKLLLLDVWYSGCVPCKEAIPELKMLQKRYESAGLQVVGIAAEPQGTYDEQVTAVRTVARNPRVNGFTYPILVTDQATSPIMRDFQIRAFPTIILVDASGDIVYYRPGLDAQLENEIKRRLAVR